MKKPRFMSIAGLVLALAVTVAAGVTAPAEAQMGPMGEQRPLDQLSGDDFDKAFLAAMAIHHAMAVMMAQPVATNAAHQEARDLATTIINDQTAEISQMLSWAKDWYGVDLPNPLTMMGGMPAGPGPADRPGPMMPGGMPGAKPGGMPDSPSGPMGQMPMGPMHGMSMMADLWRLPPQRLEATFLSLMIPHHQEAVEMAELALSRASHQELKDLAGSIISSQTAEIQQMNAWLAEWYGL